VKVLFLTYFFPPIGGAGAQRTAQMADALPQLGCELTVITGPGSPRYRFAPIDPDLGAGVPNGVRIGRIAAPEPPRSGGWRARSERWLGVRSPWDRWWSDELVRLAASQGDGSDVVYASLNPYQTADAAGRVADLLGLPLVVDLEDPWALDEMMVYPTRFHRRWELHRMRRALARADVVIMNTPEAARRVRARMPELRHKLVVAIPNGFDSRDFAGTVVPRADDAFRIVHTGTLHTDLGRRHRSLSGARAILGGAVRGVDLLPRSHVFLLEAIDRVAARRPDLARRIELHLVGAQTEEDRDATRGSSVVRAYGFVPHRMAIESIRTAELLFLPMHAVDSGRVAIVPCKTYEYLASGRPILAAVPEGDAKDLLLAAGNATITAPADVEAMARALEEAVAGWERGAAPRPPDPAVVEQFDVGPRARMLADVLAIAAARESGPSRVSPMFVGYAPPGSTNQA
jgi:glycosyltransferase involved in cell wall biosynthesis